MPGQGATYTEVRQWAHLLGLFTARDLAAAMRVSLEVGERGVKALLWHGICKESGDWLEGPNGPEPIIEYIPLPPGPRFHPRQIPPEKAVRIEMGGDPLRVQRGLPVAMSNGRSRGSTPGRWRPGRTQRAQVEG